MLDFVACLPPIKASGFINRPPLTRAIPPEFRRFVLYEAVLYDVGFEFSGDRITVPAGFITDFASVPRWLHSIIPPQGKYSGAAIIHDYLYVVQTRTRKESDLIFLEALKVLGVSKIKRSIMYNGVRLGGRFGWNRRKGLLKNV